jgi:hypothetical protein
MQCIPTFAVMSPGDPELAAARRRLAAYLEETAAAAGYDEDPSWPRPGASRYLCSIPLAHDDGTIRYVHVFQHERLTTAEEFFSVAASPQWWPVGCRSLPPQRRTRGRALLQLVS